MTGYFIYKRGRYFYVKHPNGQTMGIYRTEADAEKRIEQLNHFDNEAEDQEPESGEGQKNG